MEGVNGIDVSWIHNTHNKDNHRATKTKRSATLPTEHGSTPLSQPQQLNGTAISPKPSHDDATNISKEAPASLPKPIPPRPGFTRSASNEKMNGRDPKGASISPGTSRRNSWLSSISSKFSSSPGAPTSPNGTGPPLNTLPSMPEDHAPPSPTAHVPKNAVLPHATKADGAAPYTPAQPKSGQPNFLTSALRRLSSSGGQLSAGHKSLQHGLCQRKILNVDHTRERCNISELDNAKLRRVAFCVDVEIAGGPRYTDEATDDRKLETTKKKKMVEKGEGEALKRPAEVKEEKENGGVIKVTGEKLGNGIEKIPSATATTTEVKDTDGTDKDSTKKKEKKKRSEEERKARKEKKRKLAEANGTLPVELVRNGSDSSLGDTIPGTPVNSKPQASPTTDPVRIYRRCCQLRETPILKRITEQLGSPTNCSPDRPGVVNKLDLSGYWLQLPDLVTLGDYLAVVPIKELIMENCGLTDEGVRVLLAGLLAAKAPEEVVRRRNKIVEKSPIRHLGVIERVVLKNNSKLGREGWRHIFLFIHMARSLKSMDLSLIPYPRSIKASHDTEKLSRTLSDASADKETECIFAKALGDRLGGDVFELLNMAETGIDASQLGHLIDGANKSGLRRLGLAGNHITAEGMDHITRYLKHGKCEGLDLGGNDLSDLLESLAGSLDESNPLWALSLANCDLTPESLWKLFPALVKLKNFRFIDLSHNNDLFASSPSSLSLLRRYLPRMNMLKRIHLSDTSMNPDQAVALAEILPECPGLAHVSLLENPQLTALASATDEAHQEEACALYASLMAAVRVSKSLVCIDIDVPSPDSSEVVRALAKQVVAYCLRNMERGTAAEFAEAANAAGQPGETEVIVPDVLLHLVGHDENYYYTHGDDDLAPDQDYVIGGTGVVKALGICLRNRANDSRRPSSDRAHSGYSETTPKSSSPAPKREGGKAKDMSRNLLGSARKIRSRLQPAMIKEAKTGDRNSYNRLVFLDQTLENMIKRFEDEYPETRLATESTTPALLPQLPSTSSPESINSSSPGNQPVDVEAINGDVLGSDDEDSTGVRPSLSRHHSDVNLASKALSIEEGQMHRFGQQFRRDILKPDTEDHLHGTTGTEEWAPHIQMLRGMIEELGGEEIKNKIKEGGQDAVIKELSEEASALRHQLMVSDPVGWESFRQSQEAAQRNTHVAGIDGDQSAIE